MVNDKEYEIFDSYFHPKTIAIVGATDNPFSGGSGFLMGLISAKFPKIFPINKKKTELFGIPTYPNLGVVPEPIDYCIIAVPKKHILDVIRECAEVGVKLCTMFTSGFSEIGGEGKELENQIVGIAKKGNLRLIGPNCIGLYVPKERVTFMVKIPVGEENTGPVGIISQSGGHADMFSFMGSYRGIKYSKVISFGNGCDLHCPDFLEYFQRDPETQLIFIYLEGFRDAAMGQRFFRIASQVVKEKPILFWKGGKTEAGRGAIESHTGSLAGANEIVDNIYKQLGLVEVSNPEQVIDTLTAFYYLKDRLPLGRRLGVVGGGGGNTVSTSDILNKAGFSIPELSKAVQKEITDVIGEVGVIVRNPIDLNVSIWEGKKMRKIFDIIVAQDIDIFVVDVGIDWGLMFEKAFGMENIIGPIYKTMLRALRKINTQLPVVATIPTIFYEDAIVTKKMEWERKFQSLGIPVFPNMSRCAFALNRLVQYGERFCKK